MYLSMQHAFDIHLATKYGTTCALIVHHFQHWIRVNKKRKLNFKEEKTWSYQTLDQICDHFPYLSKDDVRGALDILTKGKGRKETKKEIYLEPLMLKKKFNKNSFDNTLWYAFINEEKFIDSNNVYERDNPTSTGIIPHQKRDNPTTIPYTKTDTKKKQTNKQRSVRSFLTDLKDPFDLTHPIWKNDSALRDQVKSYVMQKLKKNPIPRMQGYIVSCIKNSWYLEKEVGFTDPSPIKRVLDATEGVKIQNTTKDTPKPVSLDFKAIVERFEEPYRNLSIPESWGLSKIMVITNYLDVYGETIVKNAVEEIKKEKELGQFRERLSKSCREMVTPAVS